MLLDQDADEPLQAAHNGPVQDHRRGALAGFGDELCAEALRHVGIDLDRAALPLAAECIFQRVLNLRTVERALAWRDDEFAA